ncbi:MAG: hypothetical protein CVU81_02625 [Euryarchaeota archaeon HGW-Euryarchaeota-1]|nr:MAG: hypothetical protein CVU81_02625 [Euryarchaeota archaeon HGW-Euryarchaeota-1]
MEKWLNVLVDFLKIDNTNPPGKNYGQAINFLNSYFKAAGFATEIIEIPKDIAKVKDRAPKAHETSRSNADRVNLLAHLRAPGKPRLLVYSHVDVVPADEDWRPFNPRIKDGKLIARGAADMKGAIIAFLAAVDTLKKEGKEPRYDITFMATTDEETDQQNQLEYLLNKVDSVQMANVLDLDGMFGYCCIGGLGVVLVKIKIKGKSVHSGISHTGINAAEKAVPVLQKLLELKTKVEARFSQYSVNPEIGIKNMQAKLNINKINCGLKVNIVPDKCIIEVDRRLISEETIEEAQKEFVNWLEPLKKDVDFEIEFVRSMCGYCAITPFAKKLGKCLKEVGESGKLYAVMGSGDLFSIADKYQ